MSLEDDTPEGAGGFQVHLENFEGRLTCCSG